MTTSCLRQWVWEVNAFSSEFDDDSWSARSLIGWPKIFPLYGDVPGAWAQKFLSSMEFVELEFERPVLLHGLRIFETLRPGAVTRVLVKQCGWDGIVDSATEWTPVYSGPVVRFPEHSRVFQPDLAFEGECITRTVRLELDCTAYEECSEIDAVELTGFERSEVDSHGRGKIRQVSVLTMTADRSLQWVERVRSFSSEFDYRWAASCIIGPCKVFPAYGDLPGAWASENQTAEEFVDVEFNMPVCLERFRIFETNNCGGIVRLSILPCAWDGRVAPGQSWVEVFTSEPELGLPESARVFAPELVLSPDESMRITQRARVQVDASVSEEGWCEIDAIQMIGWKAKTGIPVVLRQFVSFVSDFSSQHSDVWGVRHLIGDPKVYPLHEDQEGAWAPSRRGREFVAVEFEQPVVVQQIVIYETYHPGSVVQIAMKTCSPVTGMADANAPWVVLYSGQVNELPKQSLVFSPPLSLPEGSESSVITRCIRVELDTSILEDISQIDAIQLIGLSV